MSFKEVNWNPWTGCNKCSAGCRYCRAGKCIIRSNRNFKMPIQKKRVKKSYKLESYELQYKVESGTIINTCTESDFFLRNVEYMRDEAWQIIHDRYDCLFHIITRRPERIKYSLPYNWFNGWDNVMISAAIEDNDTACFRLPHLIECLELGVRHLGISINPMMEDLDILGYLGSGMFEYVEIMGESSSYYGDDTEPLNLEWVKKILKQCEFFDIPCIFKSTGSKIKLNNKRCAEVRDRDQYGLAEFYKLNILEEKSILSTWNFKTDEIEKRHQFEQAYMIRQMINEERKKKSNGNT